MQTKHHLIPRTFQHRILEFFDLRPHKKLLAVSKREHQAWNTLTNNSSMTLGETVSSLQRFLPENAVLSITIK